MKLSRFIGSPTQKDEFMPRPKGSKNRPKDESSPKPARKPRVPRAPAAQAASSQSSGNAEFKKPPPEALLKLVKQVCSRAADQKSIGMASKELIDKAAETQGLNKKAFGMAKTLWKMGQDDPEKLAITLPHLLAYVDDLGLAEIADQNRGLAINGEDDSQSDLEDAIAEHDVAPAETTVDAMAKALKADSWDNSSPRLSIVPGPNAPTEDDEAAA
jgi:hypothetical protein